MEKKENRVLGFRKNGMHFYFGEIGVSMIWGYGSYTNNYDDVQYLGDNGEEKLFKRGDPNYFEKVFDLDGVFCQNVEIYPLGKWSKELKNKMLKHFNADDFPIGYVPVEEISYVLNTVRRLSKLRQ